MNAKDFAKKYGIWIAGFAVVGYLAYRNLRGGSARPLIGPAPPGAAGFSADQYRLESERLRQSGTLDLERLRLDAAAEAARRRAEIDRFNLESQDAARRRALEAQQRGQTLGLIGQAINALAGLFKGQQSKSGSSGGGGGFPGTPPTFPRTQPQSAPFYMIPEPKINVLYDPSYQPAFPSAPEYIPLRIDDWGEPPAFQSSGLDVDTGATFFGQTYDFYGSSGQDYYAQVYDDSFYLGGAYSDYAGYDLYSQTPELGPDYGEFAGVAAEDYTSGSSGGYSYGDYGGYSDYGSDYYGGDY